MPRTIKNLAANVAAAQAANSTDFVPTGGYLNSVEASLEAGGTSATVDIFVSNTGTKPGVKIATLTLSAATPSDGFSLPREDSGWGFVRSEVTATVGGVDAVSACIGE